jgi:PAS domain-containing protein
MRVRDPYLKNSREGPGSLVDTRDAGPISTEHCRSTVSGSSSGFSTPRPYHHKGLRSPLPAHLDFFAFFSSFCRLRQGDPRPMAALREAIRLSEQASDARVITEAASPYQIVHVNQIWCQTTGYSASAVLGKTCKVLQGQETCQWTLKARRASPHPACRGSEHLRSSRIFPPDAARTVPRASI